MLEKASEQILGKYELFVAQDEERWET